VAGIAGGAAACRGAGAAAGGAGGRAASGGALGLDGGGGAGAAAAGGAGAIDRASGEVAVMGVGENRLEPAPAAAGELCAAIAAGSGRGRGSGTDLSDAACAAPMHAANAIGSAARLRRVRLRVKTMLPAGPNRAPGSRIVLIILMNR
jgi:hypothetical protein